MESAQSFSKKHRLCSKTLSEELFTRGDSFFAWPFRCVYLVSEPPAGPHAPVQILISASKKKFKRAVDRNLIKRRTREAYRLKRHLWDGGAEEEGKVLLIAFVYTPGEIAEYGKIENGIEKAIRSVKKRIGERGDIPAGGAD